MYEVAGVGGTAGLACPTKRSEPKGNRPFSSELFQCILSRRRLECKEARRHAHCQALESREDFVNDPVQRLLLQPDEPASGEVHGARLVGLRDLPIWLPGTYRTGLEYFNSRRLYQITVSWSR